MLALAAGLLVNGCCSLRRSQGRTTVFAGKCRSPAATGRCPNRRRRNPITISASRRRIARRCRATSTRSISSLPISASKAPMPCRPTASSRSIRISSARTSRCRKSTTSPMRSRMPIAARGYPLVRAYVPPQRVSDGVFTIKVVEGYIAAMSVEGGKPDLQARIKDYLAPAEESRPLKLAAIERGLLLANDIPGVTATGILKPSAEHAGRIRSDRRRLRSPGSPADLRSTIAARISPASGRSRADAAFNGVLGDADQLSASVTGSPHSHGTDRRAIALSPSPSAITGLPDRSSASSRMASPAPRSAHSTCAPTATPSARA